MDGNVYIGNCPICHGYGMLEVVIDPVHLTGAVMCDECCTEWKNPEEAYKNINGQRKAFSGVKYRDATIEEIRQLGWDKYIVGQN